MNTSSLVLWLAETGYAVMSNHLHVILRARPDLVRDWSDEEVALRWTRLCPPRDPATGDKTEPSPCDVNMIVSDPARLAVIRQRLSSLSWFMGSLSEPIARRANREDKCKGRFSRLDKYLSLLDWTGRQLRAASQGAIPAQLAPILERLGIIGDGWVETVRHFGRRFLTAVGRPNARSGPRCAPRQSLAPGQRRRRPGLSIAGCSTFERARRTRGQHTSRRSATTQRSPALIPPRYASSAAPWAGRGCARRDRARREARRSGSRMPMIANLAIAHCESGAKRTYVRVVALAAGCSARPGCRLGSSPLGSPKGGCLPLKGGCLPLSASDCPLRIRRKEDLRQGGYASCGLSARLVQAATSARRHSVPRKVDVCLCLFSVFRMITFSGSGKSQAICLVRIDGSPQTHELSAAVR